MAKFIAEFIGTFILVLFGCGAAVLGGDHVGQVGIAFAFGLSIVAAAYGIGAISGAHVNPAVSLGFFVSGRMSAKDMVVYWIAQFSGALVAAAVLAVIAGGTQHGLGQNGWGPGYLGQYPLTAAATFEVVATFLFVTVILGCTEADHPAPALAGLAIGLTLVVIHIVGIQVTGVSVNPARSFGPALLVGGHALSQLWLFFVAPAAGGIIAGVVSRLRDVARQSVTDVNQYPSAELGRGT
jgi:aquaporin Z